MYGAAGISGLALGRAGRTRNADRSLQAPALSRTGRGIRPARLILQRKRGAEHIGEHRLRQPPRVRVVARAMIAIDEAPSARSEEHTSELQSLMRISYAVFC